MTVLRKTADGGRPSTPVQVRSGARDIRNAPISELLGW
jgi:hypothetical protein